MTLPNMSEGAARMMRELMQREVEREIHRLGVRWDAPAERISLGAPAPGVLAFREPYGSHREASFAAAMRLLAGLPNGAGSKAAWRALEDAWRQDLISPFPRNDPAYVQVGDALGGGRIQSLLVGTSYDAAKNGDPRRSLPRSAFATPESAERIIVTVGDAKGGWWRRGTAVASSLPAPAPEGRGELRRLRRDRALLRTARDEEIRSLASMKGSPDRALAYDAMLTASLRMLETSGKPDGDPLREERALLRHRVRDLHGLGRRLAAGARVLGHTETPHLAQLEGLVRRQLADCRSRLRAVSDDIAEARTTRAAPGP